MGAIFKVELRRTRFGLAVWSAVVVLLALFAIMEYPVVSQNMETLEKALSAIPKIGQLVFGVYDVDLNAGAGYHIVMYYWVGLIVFPHAVYTGASIISKEGRDNTAEFIFTKPHKRGVIIWAKAYAGFVNILAVGAAAVLMSLAETLIVTDEPAVFGQVLVSGAGMLFTQCALMAMGLLCGAVFKTYKSAVRGAALLLLACYCAMFSLQYADAPSLNFISPLAWFGVSDVVANGLHAPYVLLAAAASAACLTATQWLYGRKEIIG